MVINDALTTDFPARDRVVVMGPSTGYTSAPITDSTDVRGATERGIEGTYLRSSRCRKRHLPPGESGMRLTTLYERDLLRRCVSIGLLSRLLIRLQAMTRSNSRATSWHSGCRRAFCSPRTTISVTDREQDRKIRTGRDVRLELIVLPLLSRMAPGSAAPHPAVSLGSHAEEALHCWRN